jgi:hypothetical protein
LNSIIKQLKKQAIDSNTLEEFKTFFKYLAFVTSAAKAPIRQKMLHETLARIAKAGGAENIERWCWWTPAQLSLLELADRLTRVILIGGNGTGKTVMLDAFAMKSAKEYPEEKLTFAIHLQSEVLANGGRPLLQLDLEVKYERLKLTNVNVVTFEKLLQLKDANLLNDTVCLDEINMEDVKPEDLNAIEAKSVWIVIRDTQQRFGNQEEYLRRQFPGWVIVNLSYPLRTSKNLSDKVKSGRIVYRLHTNNFNESLQVAQNMPLGPEPLILSRSKGSYHARLQQVFSAVGKDKRALIILDFEIKPTPGEIQAAKLTTSHQELAEKTDKESQNLLVAIEAVKACQRPHGPPLLWFYNEYENISDAKESIKEWMKGKNRDISGRDLITDERCVSGYEADFVIFISSSDFPEAFMSRCRGQFVHIK